MANKERIIKLLKDCIEVDANYNGEFIETEVNYQEVADYLVKNDVVILNHGKWLLVSDDDAYEGCYECSVCKGDGYFAELDIPTPYCPHCGAKLTDTEEDNALERCVKYGEPLTIEELRQMHGKPVWIEQENTWGLVRVDEHGFWKHIPFIVFFFDYVRCEYDIESRGLTCYSCEPATKENRVQ